MFVVAALSIIDSFKHNFSLRLLLILTSTNHEECLRLLEVSLMLKLKGCIRFRAVQMEQSSSAFFPPFKYFLWQKRFLLSNNYLFFKALSHCPQPLTGFITWVCNLGFYYKSHFWFKSNAKSDIFLSK